MPRKMMTRFPVGTFAVSKTHQQFVRVLSRKGKKVTVAPAVFGDCAPLLEKVTDDDLLTLSEFQDWAPTQPWYVPPPPLTQDEMAASIRAILDRINRA